MSLGVFFRKAGQLPLQQTGLAYIGLTLIGTGLKFIVPTPFPQLFAVAALIALFVLITWFRNDDDLAAGVLFAIITGIALIVNALLLEIITSGGIGGAVLMGMVMIFYLFIRAVITGLIATAIVWVARQIKKPVV